MGVEFEIVPPRVEERLDAALSPASNAEKLAYEKAAEVSRRLPGRRVLGADTVVVVRGKILGKPDGREQARQMLGMLSESRHRVITGICLMESDGRRRLAHDVTWVTMRKIEEAEIAAYVDSREWEGKAGAYAIQETADRFVSRLEGSFDNVVGLPTELLGKMLADSPASG